ncbi:WD40-repeat-containing domain protein [Phaeosphaeriaceae sp. PMI808]|nr:WD40-repeat-containing domain protein [Phaeosphaeriaceae sp. PMI808]
MFFVGDDVEGGDHGSYVAVMHTINVYLVAFSPDSTRLSSESLDKTVKIWDASSGACLQTLEGHSVPLVAFSPDSARLASGSWDNTVYQGIGMSSDLAHFLFSCGRWAQARVKMRQHGERFGELSYALGGYSSIQEGDESIDGPIKHWRPNLNAVRATIEFAKDTGRLLGHEQDIASTEEDANEQRALRIPSATV